MADILETGTRVKEFVRKGYKKSTIDQYVKNAGFNPETFVEEHNTEKRRRQRPTYRQIAREAIAGAPFLTRLPPETPIQAGVGLVAGAAALPRGLVRRVGIPEPVTPAGRVARVGGRVAGLAGGLPGIAGRAAYRGLSSAAIRAGFGRLGTQMIAGAGGGAVTGAVYPPDTPEGRILAPRQRATQALIWGTVGGIVPLAGAVLRKTGTALRSALGIRPESEVTINEFPRQTFSADKSQANYISAQLIDRMDRNILNRIVTAKTPVQRRQVAEMLKAGGFKTEQIETLFSIDKATLKNYMPDILAGRWDSVRASIGNIKRTASSGFETVLNRAPKTMKINAKETFYRTRKVLQDANILDDLGAMRKGFKPATSTERGLLRWYLDMKKSRGIVNIAQYQKKLRQLERTINFTADPSLSAKASKLEKIMRRNAAKNIPGLSRVNKMYADAKSFEELERTFENLSSAGWKKSLMEGATDPRDVLKKESVVKLGGRKLFNDLRMHSANMDTQLMSVSAEPGGALYPSTPGLRRAGTALGARAWLQRRPVPPITGRPITPTLPVFGEPARRALLPRREPR